MEIDITDRLAILAHPKRLALLRILMRRYPDDVPAGELASVLDLKANTASNYLAGLKQVGLITQKRQGTSLRYCANVSALQMVFSELLEGCCQNRPDVCLQNSSGTTPVPSAEKPLKVLFLCSGNSARSVMAEALLTHIGAGRFRAYSAGTSPAQFPDPMVLGFLEEQGFETQHLHSKLTGDLALAGELDPDFVITVCDRAANQEPVKWSGRPIFAHWGIEDPLPPKSAPSVIERSIERAFNTLMPRILAFANLPFDELSHLDLQLKLDHLGQRNGSD